MVRFTLGASVVTSIVDGKDTLAFTTNLRNIIDYHTYSNSQIVGITSILNCLPKHQPTTAANNRQEMSRPLSHRFHYFREMVHDRSCAAESLANFRD